MQCIYKSALQLGFKPKDAKEVVLLTFSGANSLAKISNKDFGILVNEVASKGGTTEAALKVFKKHKLEMIFKEGINAACKRADKLSRKHGRR